MKNVSAKKNIKDVIYKKNLQPKYLFATPDWDNNIVICNLLDAMLKWSKFWESYSRILEIEI